MHPERERKRPPPLPEGDALHPNKRDGALHPSAARCLSSAARCLPSPPPTPLPHPADAGHSAHLSYRPPSADSSPVHPPSAQSVSALPPWPHHPPPPLPPAALTPDDPNPAAACTLSETTPQAPTPLLLSLPDEILIHILALAGADDAHMLARIGATARRVRLLLGTSTVPWRAAFLARYDDPARSSTPRVVDWRATLQARVWAERVMTAPQPRLGLGEAVAEVIVGMVEDLPVREVDDEDEAVRDVDQAIHDILHPCSPSTHTATHALSRGERRLQTLLHSPAFTHLYRHAATHPLRYTSVPVVEGGISWHPRPRRRVASPALCRLHLLRPGAEPTRAGFLRSLVYGREYGGEDAPFRADGGVDWVLADAAGTLMYANILNLITEGNDEWRSALAPLASVRSLRALARPEPDEGIVDWAGVGGLWNGAYAFMNYPDWVQLNDATFGGLTPFDLGSYRESVGDMVALYATPVASEAALAARAPVGAQLRPLATRLPTSDRVAPLYFFGEAGTGVAADTNAFMYGVVRLAPEGAVRWTMVIAYEGRDQWIMRGVQIGGVGSRRGWCGVRLGGREEGG